MARSRIRKKPSLSLAQRRKLAFYMEAGMVLNRLNQLRKQGYTISVRRPKRSRSRSRRKRRKRASRRRRRR